MVCQGKGVRACFFLCFCFVCVCVCGSTFGATCPASEYTIDYPATLDPRMSSLAGRAPGSGPREGTVADSWT
jgi:hypothetical protein